MKDKNLIYFAPGIHQLPGDTLNVPSGKTVYVAGGAIVRGCIRAVNARDVKILGRGEVHPEGRGAGISIINSRNIYVEGLITTQCPTGGCLMEYFVVIPMIALPCMLHVWDFMADAVM